MQTPTMSPTSRRPLADTTNLPRGEKHRCNHKHSIAVTDLERIDNTLRNAPERRTPAWQSDEQIQNLANWRWPVETPHESLSRIVLRSPSPDVHQDRSLRAFRERADALSFKLAVMTALAKQAHREARILEQQFLVQRSLATLNRQNALTRENNRKTSERLQGLIRRAEAAVQKHCRPLSEVCSTQ